jgi:hypothetical protein
MLLTMDPLDFDKIFDKYQAEMLEDVGINELNLRDKVMLVPILKHKWVARLIVHKNQHRRLVEAKKKLIHTLVENTPVALSKSATDKVAANDPKVAQIQENLDKLDSIIEYLEKIEKILSSMTFDCKNVIDVQKLETT